MAFVRKKGKSYYLVHNVREDGHVRQVHLACLGNRPRVSDEVLAQVQQAHPQIQIDWNAVRTRAAQSFVSPFTGAEGATLLLRALSTLHQDLEELNLGQLHRKLLESTEREEAERQMRELLAAMEGLRSQLETKLKHPPATPDQTETERANAGD